MTKSGQGFITCIFIYILSASSLVVHGVQIKQTVEARDASVNLRRLMTQALRNTPDSAIPGQKTGVFQPPVDANNEADESLALTLAEATEMYSLDIALVLVLVLIAFVCYYFDDSAAGTKDISKPHPEVIKNPLLMEGCRLIVQRPRLSMIVVAVAFFSSCIIGKHYDTLKNEALNLKPFDSKLNEVHKKIAEGFPTNPRDFSYGTVMIWSDGKEDLTNSASYTKTIVEIENALKEIQLGEKCETLEWKTYDVMMPPSAKQHFMSAGNDAALVTLTLNNKGAASAIGQRVECFVSLRDALAQMDGKFGGLHVAMVSEKEVLDASVAMVEGETTLHMMMGAPFLAVVLLFGVGTPMRASTALISLGASVASMRAAMVIIKWCYRDLNFAGPEATAQFTMCALAFDYALFFWTRFSSERRKHPEGNIAEAVFTSLTTSGYVIMLSSLVIMVANGISCFQPNANNFAYLGLALQFVTGTFFVSFYSLLIPVILTLQFPSLFDEPSSDSYLGVFSSFFKDNVTVRPSWIKRMGEVITRPPCVYLVPLGIFICLMPLLHTLRTIEFSYANYENLVSPKVPEYDANKMYAQKFDLEKQFMVSVFLEAVPLDEHQSGTTLYNALYNPEFSSAITLSPKFGASACRFVRSILEETNGEVYQVHATNIDSLWWDAKTGTCLSKAEALTPERQLLLTADGLGQMMLLYQSAQGKGGESMARKFWDKLEPEATEILEIDNKRYRFRATLDSPMAEEMLIAEQVMHRFAYIATIAVLVVCFLVGYSFGSAFICLKLVFTVCIPILAEYGLLIGIYQHGWLECIGIKAISGGMPWPLMFTTGPLLFALALDYDMFLFARVYELRLDGYDNRTAVRIALEETGPTITLAGTLMIVAFFFIFLASIPVVSIIGCLYCLGVAIDTYIVRLWVAPSALCMFETMNYWPTQMPPALKGYDDYDRQMSLPDVNTTKGDDAKCHQRPTGKRGGDKSIADESGKGHGGEKTRIEERCAAAAVPDAAGKSIADESGKSRGKGREQKGKGKGKNGDEAKAKMIPLKCSEE